MDNLNGKRIKYIQKGDLLKSSQYYISLYNTMYRLEIDLDLKIGYIIEYEEKIVLEIKGNNLRSIKSKLKRRLIEDFKVLFEDSVPLENRR
jgi:hypothetical protein